MSKKTARQPEQKTARSPIAPALPEPKIKTAFSIPKPAMWLGLLAALIYLPSLFYGFTELDDSIFIRDFQAYNEDLHNIVTAFQRGLFDAVKDPYYRPLFSDSMIINYHLSGAENIWGYHLVNILLHVCSVVLLYKLFRRLNIKELHAFVLTLVFAVHPVLSQAVAWIPGRNDTMLAVFSLAFLIKSVDYSDSGKISSLLLSGLFLLLAFFTKETAVFLPPVALLLLLFVHDKKWNDKSNLVQYGVWLACFGIWYLARAMATTASANMASATALADAVHRLPVIVQYIGKIVLPLNLSVFPTQKDTVYFYGIAAIVLLAATVLLYKGRSTKIVLSGLGIFLLFLMPALLVPTHLNQQTFEHRLYLPLIGILLMLSQTSLLNNRLADKQLLVGASVVCGVLAAINLYHQQSFKDPRSFWGQAVETSPHSAYANMMYAARLDKEEKAKSEGLFRKAYGLNPREKYLNFYMAELLQNKDSVAASEKYLLAEKEISNYYKCDFMLARVAMERNDYAGAADNLQKYLAHDPANSKANNNLLLLYLQLNQAEKAKAQIKQMRQMNLPVPPAISQQLGM